jgi:hypothetical protein
VEGAAWRAATRTMAGVEDLVQRTGDGRTSRVLGGRAIERSDGAVCGLKTTRTVFAGSSKPVVTVFSSLTLKLVATISLSLALKLAVGFLVEPQNQGGGGFSDLGLKTDSSGLVIWASKSPRWFLGFGLKTKQTSVCRLRHKTDRGRSA